MPIPPAPDDWDRIDKPVLYATALLARSPAGITSGAVAEAVGQAEPEVQWSLGRPNPDPPPGPVEGCS